jgi:uncharacterized membrane protein
VALPLAAVLGLVSNLSAQRYIALPKDHYPKDVTPDGNIVVGYAPGGGFVWRWRQDPLPTFIPGGDIVATSDDGKVFAGNIYDPSVGAEVAGRWTEQTGWVNLGWLPFALNCPSRSTAYAISGDGSTVVGLSWNACDGRGFKWTQAQGMQELQGMANGHNRCSAISRDGSAMVGFSEGNFNRTPTYWASNLSGQILDMNFEGEVHGLNNDGSKSVGTLYMGNPGFNYSAFIRDAATGVVTDLGSLNAGWGGNAVDMSEDGNIIVGYDSHMLATQAWVWTSSDGIVSLNARLASLGVAGVPPLGHCVAVSDSGDVIVGGSHFGPGFIVEMPIVVSYGASTPGCQGESTLTASPTPRVNNASFALTTTKAPPLSLGIQLISDTPDQFGSDPFGLGVALHIGVLTATEFLSVDAYSDAFGLGVAPAPIPNSPLLAGKTYYTQSLWSWPFATCYMPPFNLATSQALALTILP